MIRNEAGVTAPQGLVAQGRRLDTSPDAFGELRSSAGVVGNVGELRARLLDDGYLYLPGFLDRDAVLEARHEILCRMADAGYLAAGSAPDDALPRPRPDRALLSDIAKESASLMSLQDVIEDYASRDVDTYCGNDANAEATAATDGLLRNGALREAFGLRWLTVRGPAMGRTKPERPWLMKQSGVIC